MINNVLSNKILGSEYGVPQATVLGPTPFHIYINESFSLPSVGKISRFSDDTAILYIDKDWKSVKDKSQQDLSMTNSWFDYKFLTINSSVTIERTKGVKYLFQLKILKEV